jgi:hypothetical protein
MTPPLFPVYVPDFVSFIGHLAPFFRRALNGDGARYISFDHSRGPLSRIPASMRFCLRLQRLAPLVTA